MKKTSSVSIVIPVYNEQDYLPACLESIAHQTVKPFEVIVVDNNSTDQSVDIARQFPFVKALREKKQGIVFARNRGFDAAQGEIIGRIDADSVLPSNWVERVQKFYADEANSNVALTGAANFYDVDLPGLTNWAYNGIVFGLNKLLIGYPSLWGSNMAVTKDQWRLARGKVCRRNGLHEDLDLTIHLVNDGVGIFCDKSFQVGASLRRSRVNSHELWGYLMWWPRTLRQHARKSWLACWLVGGVGLFILTIAMRLVDTTAEPKLLDTGLKTEQV